MSFNHIPIYTLWPSQQNENSEVEPETSLELCEKSGMREKCLSNRFHINVKET